MSVRILLGDVRERLAELPPDHFDCVVTSPPYWGLRDYGVPGQIGLEPTLGEHLDVMVDVFREVRRVLAPHGTLWLNYGDCYAAAPNGRSAAETKAAGGDDRTFRDKPFSTVWPVYSGRHDIFPAGKRRSGSVAPSAGGVLKPKDLCLIPSRLAIALQEDGWWVRAEIVWAKPNAMPDSSGRFRPASAHEKVFFLAKSDAGGWWVARDTGEVSSSPDLSERVAMITTGKPGARWIELAHYYNAEAVRQPVAAASVERLAAQPGSLRANAGTKRNGPMRAVGSPARGRLLRNYEPAPLPVWEMATAAFRDAHFATFPPELVERCLDAGCPPGGCVLDPFGGAGTVGLVADGRGLDCTLIELNPDYAAIAERRIAAVQGPMFRGVEVVSVR